MSVLPNAGIHFPFHGSMIRLPTSCDMSLGMQCRAIFSGLYGQRIIPSGVLMHGKEIGFNWTNVASLPLWGLSNFSMPFVLTQNDPGEQQHVRRCVSRQATLQRILISTTRREANSRSPQDAYQLKDGQLQRKAGLMWSWMMERKVDQVLIVDGRGYLTTHLQIQKAPAWRPRRWPLTRTGLTLHMRHFGVFLKACMTLTPGSMQGGSLATMHLASCWGMARRSYANWFTCLAIGHWRDWWFHLGGLASKWTCSLRVIAFRFWLPTAPWCTQWKGNPDSHALDIDPVWISGWYHCVADA